MPDVVISIQTFGDVVNFHPHLHCLITDGCFMPNGWFHVLPEIDVKKPENLFRHKVFKMLLREKKTGREWAQKLLSWKNSGFSIHNQIKIQSHDGHGRESLAQYILCSPFSREKMTSRTDTKTVLYRSKTNPSLKRNFALFPVLDWIAEITAHIPNRGEQLVRYYGTYSNVSRGKRKKEKVEEEPTEVTEIAPHPSPGILRGAGLTSSKRKAGPFASPAPVWGSRRRADRWLFRAFFDSWRPLLKSRFLSVRGGGGAFVPGPGHHDQRDGVQFPGGTGFATRWTCERAFAETTGPCNFLTPRLSSNIRILTRDMGFDCNDENDLL